MHNYEESADELLNVYGKTTSMYFLHDWGCSKRVCSRSVWVLSNLIKKIIKNKFVNKIIK